MPHTHTTTPERKCILTGTHGSPGELLRLAVGPEGQVGADFAAKWTGRGAWVTLDRAQVETALKKGRLKAALARALKVAPAALQLNADLADLIGTGLMARALSRLGLEKRAGFLVSGADQVENALRKQQARLVVHAGDAAADGMRKLQRPDVQALQLPCSRGEIGLALGREAVVHAAVIDSAAARRCLIDIGRWLAYGAGPSTGAAAQDDME